MFSSGFLKLDFYPASARFTLNQGQESTKQNKFVRSVEQHALMEWINLDSLLYRARNNLKDEHAIQLDNCVKHQKV